MRKRTLALVIVLLIIGLFAALKFGISDESSKDVSSSMKIATTTLSKSPAQTTTTTTPVVKKDNEASTPTFSDYPTEDEILATTTVVIDYSTYPEAKEYITEFSNTLLEGVNFAGLYTVVSWGCGSNCQLSAVVNRKTGTIINYGLLSEYGLAFEKDSRLLVVNPKSNLPKEEKASGKSPQASTAYFIVKDDTFVPLTVTSATSSE